MRRAVSRTRKNLNMMMKEGGGQEEEMHPTLAASQQEIHSTFASSLENDSKPSLDDNILNNLNQNVSEDSKGKENNSQNHQQNPNPNPNPNPNHPTFESNHPTFESNHPTFDQSAIHSTFDHSLNPTTFDHSLNPTTFDHSLNPTTFDHSLNPTTTFEDPSKAGEIHNDCVSVAIGNQPDENHQENAFDGDSTSKRLKMSHNRENNDNNLPDEKYQEYRNECGSFNDDENYQNGNDFDRSDYQSDQQYTPSHAHARKRKLTHSNGYQEQLEQFMIKKAQTELELIQVELDRSRTSCRLELDKKQAEFSIELGMSVAAARKKLKEEGCSDLEIDSLVSIPASLVPNFADDRDSDLDHLFRFHEHSSIEWPEFTMMLRSEFSALFFNSLDLQRLFDPFGEKVTKQSILSALNGRSLRNSLKPFRLMVGDVDRACHEISSRLGTAIPVAELYQKALENKFFDIVEAMNTSRIDTGENNDVKLLSAAKISHLPLVQSFFAAGGNVRGPSIDQQPPLYYAVSQNNFDLAHFLTHSGAKIPLPLKPTDSSVLHIAARKGNLAMVELLVNHGANVNALDGGGWTPLHEAAAGGKIEICQFLVSTGADVTPKTKTGRKAEDLARKGMHSSTTDFLAQHALCLQSIQAIDHDEQPMTRLAPPPQDDVVIQKVESQPKPFVEPIVEEFAPMDQNIMSSSRPDQCLESTEMSFGSSRRTEHLNSLENETATPQSNRPAPGSFAPPPTPSTSIANTPVNVVIHPQLGFVHPSRLVLVASQMDHDLNQEEEGEIEDVQQSNASMDVDSTLPVPTTNQKSVQNTTTISPAKSTKSTREDEEMYQSEEEGEISGSGNEADVLVVGDPAENVEATNENPFVVSQVTQDETIVPVPVSVTVPDKEVKSTDVEESPDTLPSNQDTLVLNDDTVQVDVVQQEPQVLPTVKTPPVVVAATEPIAPSSEIIAAAEPIAPSAERLETEKQAKEKVTTELKEVCKDDAETKDLIEVTHDGGREEEDEATCSAPTITLPNSPLDNTATKGVDVAADDKVIVMDNSSDLKAAIRVVVDNGESDDDIVVSDDE